MSSPRLTRDRLVAIAHEFVAEQGVDRLTMRQLARAAGVTPGALYKHFRDKRDLERAMADAVYATVDLASVDGASPGIERVLRCCVEMRAALLRFRDGGRIVAGSYSPFNATVALSTKLSGALSGILRDGIDVADIAFALRNYTVGFVIEEQAYLALVADGSWRGLIDELSRTQGHATPRYSDAVGLLEGDRDQRYRSGVSAILTGLTD